MVGNGTPRDPAAPPCLVAEREHGVLRLTLNRPAQRNLLNVALMGELEQRLHAVRHDPDVRVVLLQGAGGGFSAGLDMADFEDLARHGETFLRSARELARQWPQRLLRPLPQPVVAMVHGFCEAGAITVLEACDIVFAADDARFVMPGLAAEQFAFSSVNKALSQVMAPRAARLFALSGEPFDGIEAERNGLATRCFPAAELARETALLVGELAAKDALALRFAKETLRHVAGLDWEGALSYNAAKVAELKVLQAGLPSARAAAVESFLAGKSKPGMGA